MVFSLLFMGSSAGSQRKVTARRARKSLTQWRVLFWQRRIFASPWCSAPLSPGSWASFWGVTQNFPRRLPYDSVVFPAMGHIWFSCSDLDLWPHVLKSQVLQEYTAPSWSTLLWLVSFTAVNGWPVENNHQSQDVTWWPQTLRRVLQNKVTEQLLQQEAHAATHHGNPNVDKQTCFLGCIHWQCSCLFKPHNSPGSNLWIHT